MPDAPSFTWLIRLPQAPEVLPSEEFLGMEESGAEVRLYFSSAAAAQAAFPQASPEPVAEHDWSSIWSADWQSIEVGKRWFLAPEGDPSPTPPGRIRLPRHAVDIFGDGGHATTQLCLELMEYVLQPCMSVLDVGCGTGILSAAALALGAQVQACDIDERCARFLPAAVPFTTTLPEGTFDVIVANIQLGVQEELAAAYRARMKKTLLVSGLLTEQRERWLALWPALRMVQERSRDGWLALLLQK
jgi:ribosomal protein L11 methyltransferase